MEKNLRIHPIEMGEEKTYHNLLDLLNVGFAHMDMNFVILDVNDTVLKMFGVERKMIIGLQARKFYPPENFESLYDLEMEARTRSDNYQIEFYFKHLVTREIIPVLLNISTNFNQKGEPVSKFVTFSDIREQKKNQSRLEKVNQALESSRHELAKTNQTLESKRDELQLEKQMLETIVFGIGDFVRVVDPDGQLLFGTSYWEKVRSETDLSSLSFKSEEQTELSLEIEGEKRRFLGHLREIHDQKEQVIAYVEILREITSQIKLEEKEQELVRMKRLIKQKSIQNKMIGVSAVMLKLGDLIARCTEVDSSVLILGETGVGKELVAQAIHDQSNRASSPFVAVNCGALPSSLLESELFGHVKGAFTGAISDHAGLFRDANGGTLFLDEVGDLDIALQVKLLRAIQEKEIRPVGSKQLYPVDVRIITATHRDLLELVQENLFRQDLYYRIAVIPLSIPPLRERKEDILPIAQYFTEKYSKKQKRKLVTLSHEAQQFLLSYEWPGNVRELENAIEHALAMQMGASIEKKDLPVSVVIQEANVSKSSSDPQKETFQSTVVSGLKPWEVDESRMIEAALIRYKGNRQQVADNLEISRSTLWRKMKMYRLTL